jgi:glycosyltransferase involved in cell wall biosynthesis
MDFDAPTGFAKVSAEIISGLEGFFKDNNIKVDILNYQSTEGDRQVSEIVRVIGAGKFASNKNDIFKRDGFLKRLKDVPYDLAWMMNDWPVIAPMMPLINQIKNEIAGKKLPHYSKPFKTLLYFPVDSPIPGRYMSGIQNIDRAVTYTYYGRMATLKSFGTLLPLLEQWQKPEFPNQVALLEKYAQDKTIGVIPHGIDTDTFHKDRQAGMSYRKQIGIPEDVMVFGTVNKNQPRKNVAQTLVAFSEVLKYFDHPGAGNKPVLYIHSHPFDPSGTNLMGVCDALGLEINRDVFFPEMEKYDKAGYSPSDMNAVYNSMDCFITTSMAEGWGLTLCEAMAVGLPVIYGDHTSHSEIMSSGDIKKGIPIRSPHLHFQPGDEQYAIRYMLDSGSLADEIRYWIESLYLDLDRQEPDFDYSDILSRYRWPDIVGMWKEELTSLLSLK